MVLHIIGIGLNDYKDITLKGLEAIKSCDKLYLEYYTCKYNSSIDEMKDFYNTL